VTPRVFSLGQAAEVLIWVIVGGLGTLIGPILGAIVLGYVKILLGSQTVIDNSLILGTLLIVVVLAIPRGVVPALQRVWTARGRWARRRESHGGGRRRLGAAP
jgi:branched-chain amino acid transport system permease protein